MKHGHAKYEKHEDRGQPHANQIFASKRIPYRGMARGVDLAASMANVPSDWPLLLRDPADEDASVSSDCLFVI